MVTNRKGSAKDWIMRAMAASLNDIWVFSPAMFHSAMPCMISAKPIRMRGSTRVDRKPASGITNSVAMPPAVSARPALVAV